MFDEALQASLDAGDRRIEMRARIERAYLLMFSDAAVTVELLEVAASAIPIFEAVGDDRSLGRAWLAIGTVLNNFRLKNAESEKAAANAVYHYRRGGWSPSSSLNILASALYFGPRPVEEAASRCQQLLDDHSGDRASEANILLWLGGLEAMRLRFDEARSLADRAAAIYEELGLGLAVAETRAQRAVTEMLAGQLETAEQQLRETCEAFIRLHQSSSLSSRAAELADVLYLLSRYDEAQTWAQTARESAGEGDLHAQVFWRSIEARLASRRGEFELAERLGGEALGIIESTDALSQHAKVLLDLAEVQRQAGRELESQQTVTRALALYEAKGNIAAARQARAFISAPAAV